MQFEIYKQSLHRKQIMQAYRQVRLQTVTAWAYMFLRGKTPVVLIRKTVPLIKLFNDLRLCNLTLSHHAGQDSAHTRVLMQKAVSSSKCFQADQHDLHQLYCGKPVICVYRNSHMCAKFMHSQRKSVGNGDLLQARNVWESEQSSN